MDALQPRANLRSQWEIISRSGPWARLGVAVVVAGLAGVVVANPVVVGWLVFSVALAAASVAGVQWSMRRAMGGGRPLDEVSGEDRRV